MHTIVGLDVSKKWLDVCLYNAAFKPIYKRFSNDDKGHKALIAYLAHAPVKLVVCEPIGGYASAICEQRYDKAIRLHQINTYSFKPFSRSLSKCKTDKHDGVPRRPPS